MKRNLSCILLAVFLSFAQTSRAAHFMVRFYSNIGDTIRSCDSASFNVSIILDTTSSDTLNTFSWELNPGFILGNSSLANIGTPDHPVFSLNQAVLDNPTDSFSFSCNVIATCNSIPAASTFPLGTSITDTGYVNYNGGAGSVDERFTHHYVFQYSFFSILPSDVSPSFISNAGSIVTIVRRYVNIGRPFSGHVRFNDAYESSLNITNVVVTASASATINYPLFDSTTNPASFVVRVNNLARLDTLIFTETILVVGCLDNLNSNHTNATMLWGCDSTNLCKTVSPVSNGIINRNTANYPHVCEVQTTSDYDTTCVRTRKFWRFKIYNQAGATSMAAHDIRINLGPGSTPNMFTLIEFDSIRVNVDSTDGRSAITDTVEIIIDTAVTHYPRCVKDINRPLRSVTYKIDSLYPGDTIYFTFYTYRCCANDTNLLQGGGALFNLWDFNIQYRDECETNIWRCGDSDCGGGCYAPRNHLDQSYNFYHGSPNLYFKQDFQPTITDMAGSASGPGDTAQFYIENVQFQSWSQDDEMFSAKRGRLKIVLLLDSGLKYVDSTFKIRSFNGVYLEPFSVRVDSCGNYYNGYRDSVTAIFRFSGFANQAAVRTFMNGSQVMFKMLAYCRLDTPCHWGADEDRSRYSQLLYLNQDSSCSECWVPLSRKAGTIAVHCPGCVTPGIIVDKFDIQRTNVGTRDNNNDGVQDNPVQPATTSLINVHRAIYNDTISSVTRAHFQDGDNTFPPANPGITYASLQQPPLSITLNNMYLEISFSGATNPLSLFDSEIDIYDASAGTWAVQNLKIPVTSIAYSNNKYFFDLSIDSLQSYDQQDPNHTLSTSYVFDTQTSAADLFVIRNRYTVILNSTSGCPNGDPAKVEVLNQMYMTGVHKDSTTTHTPVAPDVHGDNSPNGRDSLKANLLYQCETNGGIIYLYPFEQLNSSPQLNSVNSDVCIKRIASTSITRMGCGRANLFPFEYREPPTVDTVIVYVPDGYDYDSTRAFSQVRVFPNGVSSNTWSIKHNVLLQPVYTFDAGIYTGYVFSTASLYNTLDTNPGKDTTISGLRVNDELHVQTLNTYFHLICGAAEDSTPIHESEMKFMTQQGTVSDTIVQAAYSHTGFATHFTPPQPHLSLQNLMSDPMHVNRRRIQWNFNVRNVDTGLVTMASNVFFNVLSQNNAVVVDSVRKIGGGGTQVTGGGNIIYQLGNIAANATQNYRMYMHYQCLNDNEPLDSIKIYFGYMCGGYPDSLPEDSLCFLDSAYFRLIEDPYGMQIITVQPDTVAACDTAFYSMTVEGNNVGAMYDFIARVILPDHVRFISTSDSLKYSSGNTIPITIGPVISSDTLTWHLDSSSIALDTGGLYVPLFFRFKFAVYDSCEYNGESLQASIQGTSYCGTDTVIDSIFHDIVVPRNNLIAQIPDVGCTSDSVHFYSNSSCAYMLWVFGDGDSSHLQNPYHIFTTPGWYNVCFSCSGDSTVCCDELVCDSIYIGANCDTCVVDANFTYSLATGVTYNFADQSGFPPNGFTGSYSWNFGDPLSTGNNTSTQQNPVHTFAEAGIHQVCLVVTFSDSVASCTDSICHDVCVTPEVTVAPAGPIEFCDGQSDTLTASSNIVTTYQWQLNGTDIPGATNSYYVVTQSGNYTVIAGDSCGDTSNIVIVIVNPLPAVSISPQDPVICPGDSITLTASGANTYLWNPTNSTSASITVLAGQYIVTGTDTMGCSNSDTVLVSEEPPITFSPPNSSVTAVSVNGGNDGAIDVTVSGGSPPYTYYWIPGSETSEDIDSLYTGYYTLVVTDSIGCTDSVTYFVPEPPLNCDTGFTTVTQGGWGAANWSGGNWGLFMHNNFATAFPTGLQVGCGTRFLRLTTDTAVHNFLPSGTTARELDPGTITNPKPSNNCPTCWGNVSGNPVYKNVFAGQVVTLTITLAFDQLPGFSTNTFPLEDLEITTGIFQGWTVGQVYDTANKALGGCPTSYTFSDLNDIVDKINKSYDDSSCQNGSCNILACPSSLRSMTSQLMAACFPQNSQCASGNVASVSSEVSGGNPPYSYEWSTGDRTASVKNLEPGIYTLIVTDASFAQSICYGFVYQDSIVPAPYYLYKYIPGTGSISFTDYSDIPLGDATQTWSWDFDDPSSGTNDSSALQNPQHAFATPGSHEVCLTVGYADGSSSCSSVYCEDICTPLPTVYITPANPVICPGSSVSLTANGAASYLWNTSQTTASISVTSAGTYSVTGTDSNGCSNFASKYVMLDPAINLSASITPESAPGASDGAITLTVTGGTSPYSFAWSNGATTQNISGLTAGIYHVTVTDYYACVAELYCTVDSGGEDCGGNAMFDISFNDCVVTFTDSSQAASGFAIVGWYWDFDDGTYSLRQNPVHTYHTGGMYNVCLTITLSNGKDICYSTSCQEIKIGCDYEECRVEAMFNNKPEKCFVQFEDESSSGSSTTIIGWLWDFGDNTTSSLQDPIHNYATGGTYLVCLTVFGFDGRTYCSDTYCEEVTVDDCEDGCELYVKMFHQVDLCKVQFVDQTIALNNTAITGWFWDFGDGTFSTAQNPLHTYTKGDNYTVCLTVFAQSAGTNCQQTKCVDIEVKDDCELSPCELFPLFNYSVDDCIVHFVDFSSSGLSTTITGWEWSFDDGTYSNQANPTHTFSLSGTYNVCLTLTGTNGEDDCSETYCIEITIGEDDCTDSECLVTAGYHYVVDGCTVHLIDASVTGSNTTIQYWQWTIAGNVYGANDLFSYTVDAGGVYEVCMYVYALNNYSGAECEDQICMEIPLEDCGSGGKMQPATSAISYSIIPNPNGGKFDLMIHSASETSLNSTITDSYGRKILERKLNVESGNNRFEFSRQAFARGIYFIRLEGIKEIRVLKMVVH